MNWIYLLIAGVLEIIWAVGLKYTNGFSKLIPSVITVAAMYASFWFLSLSLKSIPIGSAYAVWTGIGAIGTAMIGILYFGEPSNILRIISFVLILLGIVGLKLFS